MIKNKICACDVIYRKYASQNTLTCSKSKIETIEKGVKYVES